MRWFYRPCIPLCVLNQEFSSTPTSAIKTTRVNFREINFSKIYIYIYAIYYYL